MEKTDIFVDAAMKPYNFYLCEPLNRSERLIQMIQNNGGNVVNDYMQTCIIISSKDYPVPEHLKSAHIYSYEFIQDSANRGSQQQFPNYLIHVPHSNNGSIPHQFNDKNLGLHLDDVDVDVDSYDFESLSAGLIQGNDNNNGINDAGIDTNLHNEISGALEEEDNPDDDGDDDDDDDDDDDEDDDEDEDEDNDAYEDANDGNNEDVYANDYDVHSHELNLGGVEMDDNINPINDVNHTANNTTTNAIAPYDAYNVRYFTDEEDQVLMEELRKRHWMGIKGHSVYQIISQLPFFRAKQRTPSSLRERMRTLKYNVGYVYKLDSKNRLLKDANGHYIKTTNIKAKLTPYIAADDLIFCKTVYLKLDIETDEYGFETVVFPTNFYDKFANVYDAHTAESWRQRFKNYLLLFGIKNYLKYYIVQVKQNKQPLPSNLVNKEWLAARKHIKKNKNVKLYFPNIPVDDNFIDENLHYTIVKGYDNKIFEFNNPFRNVKRIKTNPEHEEFNGEYETDAFNNNKAMDVSNSKVEAQRPSKLNQDIEKRDDMENNIYINYLNDNNNDNVNGIDNSATNAKHESQTPKIQQSNIPSSPEIQIEEQRYASFFDEPTTEFREATFIKSRKKHGIPIDLAKWENKEEFIRNIKSFFADASTAHLQPRELSRRLLKFGIKEYYTVFLFYRCHSVKVHVLDSLINYIRTDGRELLAMKPGIWSNKSIDLYEKNDPEYNTWLKEYHGERLFRKQSKWLNRI